MENSPELFFDFLGAQAAESFRYTLYAAPWGPPCPPLLCPEVPFVSYCCGYAWDIEALRAGKMRRNGMQRHLALDLRTKMYCTGFHKEGTRIARSVGGDPKRFEEKMDATFAQSVFYKELRDQSMRMHELCSQLHPEHPPTTTTANTT